MRTIPSQPNRFSDQKLQRKMLFPAPYLQLDWAVPFKMRSRQKPVGSSVERVSICCFQDIARLYTRLVHRSARQHPRDFEKARPRYPPSLSPSTQHPPPLPPPTQSL